MIDLCKQELGLLKIYDVNDVISTIDSKVILRGMHNLKKVEGLGAISAFSQKWCI